MMQYCTTASSLLISHNLVSFDTKKRTQNREKLQQTDHPQQKQPITSTRFNTIKS